MRMTGWHVDGYGHFHDRDWTDLPAGLTVFHGPNEAGKSTLLSFLRSMLFGFKGGNTKDPAIPALDGGRHGGTLRLVDERGAAWTIERHGRDLRLIDASGVAHDESALRRLLGLVGRDVFEAVFAFSLQELEQLGGLDEDALRDQLFASSLTGGGSSAHGALTALDKRVAALYRPTKSSPLKDLGDRLKDLRVERREAVEGQASYAELRGREASLDTEVARLGDELRERRRERDRLDRLERLWETLDPLERDRAARATLDGLRPVARETVTAATETAHRRTAAEDARRDVVDRRARRAGERDELAIDERLVAVAGPLDALSREAAGQRDRLAASVSLQADRDRRTAAADEAVADLGGGWDGGRVRSVDASLPARQAAAAWGARVVTAEAEAVDARKAADDAARVADVATEDAERCAATLRATPEPPAAADLARTAEALVVARAGVAELPVRRQVAAQAEQALEALRRLSPQVVRRDAGEGVRVSVLVIVAIVSVVAGLGLAVAGQPVGGASLVVVGIVVAWVDLAHRRARAGDVTDDDRAEADARTHEGRVREQEDRVDAARAGVEELEQRLRDVAPRAGLAPEVLLGGAATEAVERRVEDVRTLQAERVAFEELRTAAAGARAAAELASERADDAAAAHDEAVAVATRDREGWRSWAADRGLPHDLAATHAAELLTAIERVQQMLRGAQDAAGRARDTQAEVKAWTARARGVLGAAGREDEDGALRAAGHGDARGVDAPAGLARLESGMGRDIRASDRREGAGRGVEDWVAGFPQGLDAIGIQELADTSPNDEEVGPPHRLEYVSRTPTQGDARPTQGREAGSRTPTHGEVDPSHRLGVGPRTPTHEDVLDAVLAAHRDAQVALELVRRRGDLDGQLADDDAEITRLEGRAERETARLGELLRDHGVADLDALERTCRDTDRRTALDEAIAEREAVVRRVAGGGEDGDVLTREARNGDVTGWAARRSAIEAELPELERRQRQAVASCADAASARRALEDAVDLPRIDGETEQVRADAAVLMADVRTAFRARDLIVRTLDDFVRDQQPTVLRDASAWFEQVTGGRYTEVRQVVTERGGRNRPALQVVGPRAAALDPAVLSRGTREQLYLCLRLALARSTAQQATPLPLVMDDVLVNFSPDRARAVAEVLAAVAEEQQVLFFTCHPGTRELLAEAAKARGRYGCSREVVRVQELARAS